MNGPLLSAIQGPRDLKSVPVDDLKDLAQEIRDVIVETVASNGGHLAANLGVVELTLALHHVFDVTQDRIVWDVGHQCYAHKLLTGRREIFHTLRKEGGLSGFPKPSESQTDAFGTGHSSTSISASLGLAQARDLTQRSHDVIAVIGDGSIPGGMAFEALNHAGHLRANVIIVLNDNEMSISPTVGALSSYFSRILTDPRYNRFKDEVKEIVGRVPSLGGTLVHITSRVEESLKSMLVPGGLFEEFGIRYFGPIDGHDLRLLVDTFADIRSVEGPRLVHLLTRKGKGFPPAETKPEAFHSSSPFVLVKNGGHASQWTMGPSEPAKPLTYTGAFSRALVAVAEQDPLVVAVTAAMPNGTGLGAFQSRFPDRFFDVGIAEQHAITFAAGLAKGGLKPVVAVYSTFLQRAYDQIVHDVCLQGLPVVLALDRAGLVGEDGPTHHGLFDVAFLSTIPSMVCMAPKDGRELQRMLRSCLTWGRPVAIRYPRAICPDPDLEASSDPIEFGQAEELIPGAEVGILAYGSLVFAAVEAAQSLRRDSIDAGVVNLRFASPVDSERVEAVAKRVRLIVTVEEHATLGGVGSRVLEVLADHGIMAPVLRLGLSPGFPVQGERTSLLRQAGLDSEGMARRIRARLDADANARISR